MRNFPYYVREGIRNMFSHGFMSFAAVGITVACLVIMGTFTLVAVNLNENLKDLERENEILAFVDDSYSEEEARALQAELEKIPNVTTASFITRAEALAAFQAEHPDEELYEDLDPEILRDRFAIRVESLELLRETASRIDDVTGIADVNAYEEISDGFITLRNVATVLCVSLILILFVVSVFIIANTIKLTTFDRREEIAIMRMVGAKNSFISWPFVYEGFLLGIFSAVVAFLLQWALYEAVTRSAADSQSLQLFRIVAFSAFWKPVAGSFLAAGMLMGVGGSLSAIRKFLDV